MTLIFSLVPCSQLTSISFLNIILFLIIMPEVILQAGLSKKAAPKKSWKEDWRIAGLVFAVGMAAIVIIFYFLFADLLSRFPAQ